MMTEKTNRPSAAVQQARQRFGIVGNAPALTAALERAVRVAPIDLSVLVCGESGTGKEFFPQIIHAFSSRKHGKYIAVNCGAIPEGTIDSELFGHEKGAFTGAVDSRKGYFEEADGGTIFLDEVAELPLTTQARLLRVLESGQYLRVGSSEVQRTNVRIVAATNVDLPKAISEGRFREDLFYRLSTVMIVVPPLRERGADIDLLAYKFSSDFAERYRVDPVNYSPEAMALLRRYRWPGNVRQLKNIIDQIALFHAGSRVEADTVEEALPAASQTYMPATRDDDSIHSYSRERDMLLGMILNLQRRVDELQRRSDSHPHAESANRMLSEQSVAPEDKKGNTAKALIVLDKKEKDIGNSCADVVCEEVETIESSVPATMQQTEKQAIEDSLRRNEGKRKAAAAELQISERTLYRKIKEYGLE